MSSAILFAGQGSQYKGMGVELIEKYPKEFQVADTILCYSVEDLLMEDEYGLLNDTLYTQPLLYIVSSLAYREMDLSLKEKIKYAAGHSLGEFTALYAAGVFDFETGLKIVAKRSKLMSRVQNGAMAAVIGLDIEKILDIINELENLYIANYNTKLQTVVSGEKEAINAAREIFMERGATGYYILKVSCPCHSPLMTKAADEFRLYIEQFPFNAPKFPVISNYTGKEYEFGSIKDTISLQMCNPVLWRQSIAYLIRKKVDDFMFAGPSSVIKNLLKYNIAEEAVQ